jgi:hypothetical protein
MVPPLGGFTWNVPEVMLKNDNEGNFKINFNAENLKDWEFLNKKSFDWVFLRVFCSFYNKF